MKTRPLVFVFLCVILIGFITDSSGIRKQGSRHFKSYGIGSHVRRNASSPEGYGLWPSVFNLATKAMISVNATCGESGREEFCRMVEGGRGRCGICDNFSSDPGKKHPIGYAIDGTNRWWQSPALQYGREYEHVTLTIDLKQVYQIAYVIIKAANSPRPGTWILERSLLGNHYEPWQYFARSDKECLERFGVPATKGKPHYFTDSEVICTSFYSRLTPMENGEIHTSLVHGRPGANETSPELLEFTKARFVRLRLMGLRGTVEPLPRWFTQDILKDKRLFYTIRDISIGGQCVCNGHAENCRHNVASGHPECECGHHTCGPNCEMCCPMFNQRQWGPGSSRDGRQCLPCNCHGHATSCHYDENVDRSGRSVDIHGNYQGGGVCNNCTAHTTGINCEKCIKGYYRPFGTLQDAEEPCVRCDCDPAGSKGTCVQDGSLAGTCDCLPGFAGPRCDTCAQRYRGFPNCEACPCDPRGTGPMEDCEGECICKVNVEGKYCNQCKSGHFALRSDNPDGCLTCICSGATTLCESAVVKYSKIETLQDWMITDIKVTQLAKPTWDEKGIFSQGNYELPDIESLYWLAPAPYLGNKLESYNSILTYKVHWVIMRGDTSGKPTTGPNIILIGQNGLKIAHGNDFFTSSNMTFNIGLVEDGWYHVPAKVKDIVTRLKRTDYKGDPVNRRQFLSVLSDIKSVLLRATFHTDQIEALLEQASLEVERGEANSEVERCSCPSGYTGLSCETCAFGYVRIFANSSFEEQQGFCGKCDCNGHSESCNADTGDCFCQHNTLGESCERCAPGFYGNPLHGTPDDCKKCACPLEVDGNNFSPSCQLDYFADSAEEEDQGGYVCTQCPTGYTGDHCEICDDGYFGNPMEIGNSCIPCDCNGGPCDRLTGQCLRCKGNTEGWKCERCKAGHYGDASSANCKDCQCDPLGAVSKESCNNDTGQCICKERFTGRTCDKCETGYGNVTALCTSCACSPTGSKSSICDPHTGLCDCHTGVEGFHCDTCQNLHYGFSETGCKACNCDPQGSQFPTCEQHSGQCLCKSHFTGLKCDRCEEGYWKDGAECVPCLCDDEGSLSQSCDQQTGICFCKAGVAPPTCNACLPNHYGNIIEGCKECDVCDKEGYICDPETGKCVCPPLTMGLKCEKCKQNTYGNPGIGCKACECSLSGSSKLQCDKKTGKCTCKVGFEGEKCDRCSYGYYGYKHCKKCNCDPAGTIPEDCSHESCRCTEDGCRCKANVRGKYCDTCKEGTFGIDLKNLLGCTECFCFGRSRNCSSAGYSWEQIQTDQVTQDTCIDNAPCWTLPSKFTGDLTSTYGGFLRVTSNSALPSNNRIFLTGNGITIGARAPEPEVMMVENNWRVIQDTLPPKLPQECANFPTRACLLAIFQNVTKIQIEIGPSFRTTDFTEVVLDKAVDSRGISRASTVEGCGCPKEYTSLSCQDPSSGYYRYYPKELETNNYIDRIIGIARRCHCNNKSHVCDRQTGHCQNCSDHTTGPHCEFCITGYYKDMSGKCLPCLCPTDKLNFAASCEPEPGNQPSQFVCNCLPGYTGAKCDRCEGTYFGNPWKDGFCQPCDCNPYGSESQICNDATGACVCKAGFTGRTCSQCVSPREVIQNGVCTPCDECTQILFNTLDNLFLGLNKTLDLFKDGLGPPWPVLNLTLHRYKLFSSKFDSDLNKAYDLIENAHLDELEEKVTTLNNYLNLKKQKADQQIKAIKGLQADSESISEEAVVLQNRINEIIKNLHDFGQSHVNTQDALKEARTLLKDINEKSSLVPRPEEYEDLFKKCDDLTKEINEVYKGDNNPDEMKANLSALKKRLGALNSLLDQTEVMNKLAKNKNKRNTARIAKLNETISDINARNYAVNGELTDLVGLINATTNLLEDIEKLYEMLSGIDIEGTTKQLEGDADEVPQLYDLLEKVGDHVKDLQDKIKTYKSMFNFTSEEWKKINASAAYENLVRGIEEAKNSANEAQDIIIEAMKMLMGEPGDDTLSDRASIAQGLSDRLKQRIRNLKNPTDEFKKIRDDLERLKYEILKNGRNNNDLTTVLHNMRQQIKQQSEHVDDLERVKEEAGNVSDRMANIEKEVKNLNITTQYDLIKTYHKYLNLTSGDEISKLQDKVTLARMELQDLHINFTHIDIIKKINDEKFQNTNENLDSIEAKINILKNKIQYAKQAADSINIAMDLTNCARHYRLTPDVFKTVTLTFKCKTCNLLNLTNSKGQFLTINVINKDIVVGLNWKHQEPNKIETKTLKGGDNTTTIQIEKIGSIMELRTEQGGTEIDSATIPIGKELFKIGDEEHYLQVGKIGNQEEACLQKLVLNDHVIGLWNFVQSFGNCPGCQKDTSIAGSKILFGGNGYRNVTGARNVKPDMVDLQFYFTTFDENSLLFLAQDKENRCSYIALTLINGYLELRVRHIDGTEVFLKSKRRYNNGIETRVDIALLYRNGQASYSLSVEVPNSEPDKTTETKKLERASVFKIRKSEIFLGGLPGTFDKHCIPVTAVPFLGYLRSGNAEYNDPVRTTAYDTKLQSGELKFTKAWFSGEGFLHLGGLGHQPSQDHTSLSFLLRQPSPNGFVMNFGTMLDIYLKNEKLVVKINENPITIEPSLYKDINYIEIEINKDEVTVSVNDNPPTSIGKIKISERNLGIYLGKDKNGKEHPNYVGGMSNIVLNNKTFTFDVGTVKEFSKVEIGREKPLPQLKIANKNSFGSVFEPHSIREMQNTEGCAIVTNYETDPDAVKLGDKKDSYIFVENSFWRRDYVLELQFRTFYPNGLLFLSVGAHQQKQFNLLEIKEGKVQLKMKGKKMKVLTMPDKVNDGVWHYVQIKQSGVKKKRKLTISLDGMSKKPVRMPKSNVKGELYVGGVPDTFIDYIEIKNQMHSFRGCMKSLKINNVLQVLVKNKKNVSYNNIGQCFPRVERGAYFSGDSYAIYKGDFKVNKILELSLEFRTPEQNGILLSVSNFGNSPALSVELQNGAVVMTIDMGNGAVFNVTNSLESEFTLCNNKWHNITALYSSSELTVNVDGIRKTWVQLDVNSLMDEIEAPLYVGGLPDNAPSGTLKTKENFKGCIRKLKIEDRLMDWTDMKELSNVLLHSCPVIT